jgi:cell wall-associated NlpC family hydrolase
VVTVWYDDRTGVTVRKSNDNHDELGRFASGAGEAVIANAGTFEQVSRENLSRWSEETADKTEAQWKALSDEERVAILRQTGGSINRWVGESKGRMALISNSSTRQQAVATQSGLNKMSLPANTVLYKGVDMERFGITGVDPKDAGSLTSLTGKVLTDHAFGSSTVDPEVGKNFQDSGLNRMLLRIEAPAGTKGAWLGSAAEGGEARSVHSGEREFMMPLGMRYTITGAGHDAATGRTVLHVRILPPDNKHPSAHKPLEDKSNDNHDSLGRFAEGPGVAAPGEAREHADLSKMTPSARSAACAALTAKTDAAWKALSPAERSAVKNYCADGFEDINPAMGKAGGDPTKIQSGALRAQAQNLAAAIDKGSLPQNMALFKAVNLTRLGAPGFGSGSTPEALAALVGKMLTDHSFGSTSAEASVAWDFSAASRVMVKINAAEGTPALWLGSKGRSSSYTENEVLLQHGSRYVVTGVTKVEVSPGKHLPAVEVTLLPHEKRVKKVVSIFNDRTGVLVRKCLEAWKGNDNHDNLGRFAISPSGGTKGEDLTYLPDSAREERYQALTDGQWDHLSQNERDAIDDYTGSISAYEINRAVDAAGGDPSKVKDAGIRERAQTLAAAIDKSNLPRDLTVFRGVNLKFMGVPGYGKQSSVSDLEKLKGRVLTAGAFESTSFNPDIVMRDFSHDDKVLMRIEAPKGANGVFLGGNGRLEGEREILFQHGTRYVVTGARKAVSSSGRSGTFLTVQMLKHEK